MASQFPNNKPIIRLAFDSDKPCTPNMAFLWVVHKILVTVRVTEAKFPFPFLSFGFGWNFGTGLGLRIVNK